MSNSQNPQTSNLTDNSVELNSNLSSNLDSNTNLNSDESTKNLVEISPSLSSDSPVADATSTKNNKTPLIAAGLIGGLVLVAVVAGIGLSNSPKESKSAQNSISKSTKSEEKNNENKSDKDKSKQNSENKSDNKSNEKVENENENSQISQNGGNLINNSTNSTLSTNSNTNSTIGNTENSQNSIQTNTQPNSQNSQNSNQIPSAIQTANSENKVENKNEPNQSNNQSSSKPMTEAELKLNEESKAVDKFFEVKATNEKLNLNPLTMTKEDAKILKGDESKVAIPAVAGKKFRVTLEYSNLGDKDFEQATLTVNVDKALKILPGTVKDDFEGKSVTVSDSLFKENEMKYGPGTADKDMAGVKVGQKGKMTIDVEVPPNTAPGDYRISTTLDNPNGSKKGIPGIFFLVVK